MRMNKFIKLITVLIFSFEVSNVSAQQVKFSQGITISHFDFQNAQGQSIQGLKPGSGISMQLAFHKTSVVDTAKINIAQTPLALYLGQHPFAARLATMLNYDLGVQFFQMNAVGDVQQNAFSYQTNYFGVHGKLGLRISLPFKTALNLQGIASINKIIQGNQLLLNRYVDLTTDSQFNQIKLMTGFGLEFEKRFSDKLAGLVSYQYSTTFNQNPSGQSTLNFQPSVVSVGIRFLN